METNLISEQVPSQEVLKPKSELLNVQSVEELVGILEEQNIDYSEWRKSPEDLYEEIKSLETQLMINSEGGLERHINTVLLKILSPNGMQQLVEDRQVSKKDGAVTRRGMTEIAEKHKAGEEPMAVAYRAISEELLGNQLFDTDTVPLREMQSKEKLDAPKSAYDGLATVNNITRYIVRLPEDLYRGEGYTEVQEKKTNYMVWKTYQEISEDKRRREAEQVAEEEAKKLQEPISEMLNDGESSLSDSQYLTDLINRAQAGDQNAQSEYDDLVGNETPVASENVPNVETTGQQALALENARSEEVNSANDKAREKMEELGYAPNKIGELNSIRNPDSRQQNFWVSEEAQVDFDLLSKHFIDDYYETERDEANPFQLAVRENMSEKEKQSTREYNEKIRGEYTYHNKMIRLLKDLIESELIIKTDI